MRNFRDSSNCDLNAMCSKCFPVRKTYKHMSDLDNVVKHYFCHVRNFTSKNTKYFLLRNCRKHAVILQGLKLIYTCKGDYYTTFDDIISQ